VSDGAGDWPAAFVALVLGADCWWWAGGGIVGPIGFGPAMQLSLAGGWPGLPHGFCSREGTGPPLWPLSSRAAGAPRCRWPLP